MQIPADARRQSIVFAAAEIRSDHRIGAHAAKVADITYLRMRAEFAYWAVIRAAFSWRMIGWALGRTLEDKLTLRAMRMALEERRPPAWIGASLSLRRVKYIRRFH
jgi:transposase InsO family protein